MRKLRVALATTLAALAVGFVATPTVSAHRTDSAGMAEGLVYNAWNSHCGNGASWVCVNRKSYMYTVPVGVHSWQVEYHWIERGAYGLGTTRNCGVVIRDEHYLLVEKLWGEVCW